MNTFITFLVALIFVLVLIMIIRAVANAPIYEDFDEEVIVTTTTTTVDEDYDIVGNLLRVREGNQYFVIDPADKDKIYVNDKDDLYEDGADRIWRLI